MASIEYTTICGVHVHTAKQAVVFELLEQLLTGTSTTLAIPTILYTPNPEIVLHARKNSKYRAILNAATLNLPDGFGLKLVQPTRIQERITGSDTTEFLLELANTHGLAIGIIYRADGLSSEELIHTTMAKRFPNCTVYTSTSTFQPDIASQLDLIVVGIGFPQQEEWIHANGQQFPNSKLIIAVGGSIDFITKQQQRAPLFLRRFGLEWLWRVIKQPHRIKRIITAVVVFPFVYLYDTIAQKRY